MSRIGKQPIPVPTGVKVSLDGDRFVAEGPKGKVAQKVDPGVTVDVAEGQVTVQRRSDDPAARARHGLVRSLLANAVHGVSTGFSKSLEIVGVGYRGEVKGREAHFALGYSHPVVYPIREGIDIEIDKSNKVTIRGADRQQVGQVAAEIRSLRPPDPYKAKGIRYSDEIVRRKVGKAGAR